MTDDPLTPTVGNTLPVSPSDDRTPQTPDPRYALRNLLGRGGMGEVWLARDLRIDREVAIKMMRGDKSDTTAVARFLREARVQGRLEHPAIAPVHDLGGEHTGPYFVMKRVSGTTLADVFTALTNGDETAREKWTRPALLTRIVDVCLAIELAHQRGVIHRDLKPANIMLGDFGETYVLDWGLARIADDADDLDVGPIQTFDLRSGSDSGSQTVAGQMLGTPGYMAPEQMRGESVDSRTDIYAIGCMLFEILVGEPAVARDKAIESTLAASVHRPRVRRPDGDIAPELDDLVARATEANPKERVQSAREIADAIQSYLDGDRDLARRRELAGEHAKRAADALAKLDIPSRATAMREAGRALVLDPGNTDAQAVLAKLLLEPPEQIPPEARARIESERLYAGQKMLRIGTFIFFAFALLVPIIWWIGARQAWPLLVIDVLCVGLGALCFWASSKPRPIGNALLSIYLVSFTALLALSGIVLGPLLLMPIVIIGSVGNAITMRSVYAPRRIVLSSSFGFLIPLGLELAGILPPTFHATATGLTLEPWAIHLSSDAMLVAIIATFVIQMIASTSMLHTARKHMDRAQELIHLQSWHLRQIVH